jgi:hypothetical protein
MAKLSTTTRKAMPKKDFAGAGKTFPIQDKEHARLAISGATRSERAGNISKGTEEKIKSEARAKLGKSKHHPEMDGWTPDIRPGFVGKK